MDFDAYSERLPTLHEYCLKTKQKTNQAKNTPFYPRERLKCFSKNYLIRNQTDKKIFPQILPQKKLIQKSKTSTTSSWTFKT